MNVLRQECKSLTFMSDIRNCLICMYMYNLAGLKKLSYIK